MATVTVKGVPAWLDETQLLGPGNWEALDGAWVGELPREEAADLGARLRGLGLGGQALVVEVRPALKRPLVRDARTNEARRRRDTTPGFRRAGTKLDEEGRWSLTPEAIAESMGRNAAGLRVIDATCGAGGNTIGFARAGCSVVAVDIDAGRLELARHNAKLYGVADRIDFRCADAADVLGTTDADLVFVDPPWGTDYDHTRTTLADLPVLGHLAPLTRRFRHAWFKVPPSFLPSELPGTRPEAVFGLSAGDKHRVKFLLLRRGP